MKILIVPAITQPRCDAAYQICANLITLFRPATIAVCASRENHFHHVSLYQCPVPCKSHFFREKELSYETHLSHLGLASLSFLQKDMDAISYAVNHFEPDMIFTLDRIAAIPIALKKQIPIVAFVHSCMYLKNNVPVSSLKGINTFLKENNMTQILHLRDLYRLCTDRIGFGISSFFPYPEEEQITRIGSMSFLTPPCKKENDICIFFSHVPAFKTRFRHIIEETFNGAPFTVHVYYPHCKSETKGNIHYTKNMKTSFLIRCSVCIHSGDDYLSNICESFAIPQIIYADPSCTSRFNSMAIRRNNVGFVFTDRQFSLKTMYESYRCCITDSHLQKNLSSVSLQIQEEGNLSKLLNMIKQV